ncbi:uncharacterized protein LOC134193271 [Corticium candelabrum]|uniref:uncharacterized protein LOC134193271 n=1 Tax=Corticium candelabrum TaxID=121492 RepID=UPI002E2545EC|nr:uncharacterized protein LOC134193271 [Corticium candelabrum]
MEALVRGLFTAVMSVIGLVYFFCWSPRLRLLGLCHILLFSTAAACCSLYHFTANNVYVDKEWPNTFTTAFDTCFLVAQVWAILLRFALPCHAGSNCKLFGQCVLVIFPVSCLVVVRVAGLLSWSWITTLQWLAAIILVLWDVIDSVNVSVKVECIVMSVVPIVGSLLLWAFETWVLDLYGIFYGFRFILLSGYALYYINMLARVVLKNVVTSLK